jgi:hypothetical protein
MPIDFSELESAIKEAVLDGVEEWAWVVCGDAKANCPVSHGYLQSSGTVERDDTEVVIGFGGNQSRDYAERIHEDASMFHKVGEDHYLENAANGHLFGNGAELKGIINDRVQAVLE